LSLWSLWLISHYFTSIIATKNKNLMAHSNFINAVIFDLDGTLLDTEELSTQATEMALRSVSDEKITLRRIF